MPNPFRCANHPAALAGWRCPACAQDLCPDCVATERAGATGDGAGAGGTYETCLGCGAWVQPLTVPGSPWSFWELLRFAVQVRPSLTEAAGAFALYAAAFAATDAPAGWAALAWVLLVAPLFWLVFFALLQQAARTLDPADGTTVDARQDVLLPAARAWPLTLAAGAGIRATGAAVELGAASAAWVLGLSLTFPLITLDLATRQTLFSALDPRRMARQAVALGSDYALAVAVTGATTGLAFYWVSAADYIHRNGVEQIFPLGLQLCALYAFMVQARFVGVLLTARGAELGLGTFTTLRVLALPGVAPRAVRAPRPPPPPTPPPAPLELAPEEDPLGAANDLPALVAALEGGQLDRAVAVYGALTDLPPTALSPTRHLELGQAAAARGQFAVSVRALKAASTVAPDHPDAARACVILARLYAERLGQADAAKKLYAFVVQRYPGTQAARFAQARLSGPAPGGGS